MRWLCRIGVPLLVLVLGLVAWMLLGDETPDGTTPPDAEGARAVDAPRDVPRDAPVDDGDGGLPVRRRVAADAGAARTDDAGPRDPTVVTGVVLAEGDDDVAPAGGATVRFYVDGDTVSDPPDALTTTVVEPVATSSTGADGRFSFDVARGAPWRVWVTTDDGRASHARGIGGDDAGELYLYELARCRITTTDEEDRPLAGALAYLYSATFDTLPFGVAHAGADGVIALDPAPGCVVVTAPGHGFAEIDSPHGEVRAALPLGVDLAGVVVDDTDAPLGGVPLTIDDSGPERTLRTDADGRFRFERVGTQDEVHVWVHDGPRKVMRILGYGDLDARIVIPRRGDIAGVVVHADGSPAADARVEDRPVDREARFVIWTDGRDRSRTLTAIVPVRVPGFGLPVPTHRASLRVELTPGETTDVRLVLEEAPRSFLRLRVVAPDGTALHGSRVVLPGVWHHVQHSGATTLVAVGAAPGTSLDGVIYASRSQHLPHHGPLVTSARWDDTPTEIRLRDAGPALLRVFTADGDEVERGDWTLVHIAGGTLLGSGRIEAPPGAWLRVVLEARGRRFEDAVRMPSDGSDEVRIHFPATARVTGRLVRDDGTPARALDVVVVPRASVGAGPMFRAVSAADGSFALDDVPTGRALLVVWQSEGEVQAQRREIDVPTSGTLELGTLLAWSDVALTGRVLAPTGESPAGVAVDVMWDAERESAHAIAASDGSFRVRVPGVPEATVRATRRGRLFGIAAVDLSRTDRAELRVLRTGGVRVRSPDAWADDAWDVTLAAPDRSVAWTPSDTQALDGDRVIVVDDAPEGTWLLRAVRGGDVIERTIVVAADEETFVQLAR